MGKTKELKKTLVVDFRNVSVTPDKRSFSMNVPRADNSRVDANLMEAMFLDAIVEVKLIPPDDVEDQATIEGAGALEPVTFDAEIHKPSPNTKSWGLSFGMHAVSDEEISRLIRFAGKRGKAAVTRKGSADEKRGRKPKGDVPGQQTLGGDVPE